MAPEFKNEIDQLKASVKGNADAFEPIVTKYQPLVCAITYGATYDFQKSEELAQETFVNAWKNLTKLNDLAKFKAWLCAIAKTVISNHYRRAQRDPISAAAPIEAAAGSPSTQQTPLENVISKEETALLSRALSNIPEKYRQPLILFYRCDQSTKAVAAALDITEATARQRLHRGRKMLKDQLTTTIETTLARTAPTKTFTTAVMASIAGITAKTAIATAAAATTIAAASSTATTATTTAVATGILSTVTAKIVATAAAIAIATGATLTYKHITNDTTPRTENAPVVVTIEDHSDEPTIQLATKDQPNTEAIAKPLAPTDTTENTTPAIPLDTTATQPNTAIPTPTVKTNATGTLVVKVIDRETQLPIPNAKVRTYPKYNPNHYTTDESGTCTIDLGETRPIHLNLFAEQGNYTPMSISFNPSSIPLIPADFSFELTKGTPISGHVQKLSDGQPVEGATVKVSYSPHDAASKTPILDLRDCAHTTDKDGNWQCNKTPKDLENLSLKITHPDYAERRKFYNGFDKGEISKRQANASLTPGYNITGYVTDEEGSPIQNASVFLGENRFYSGDEVLKTDAKGYYEFLHRTPLNKHAVVSIQAGGYAPEMLNLDMTPDLQPSQVMLQPAKTISIHVIDPDGNPIQNAQICLGKWRDHQSIKFLGTIDPDRFKYTDADGRFKWTNAPTDEIKIGITKTGFRNFADYPLIASDEEYEITLYRPIRIAGNVIDAETKDPIKDFTLIPGLESIDRPGSVTFQSSVGWRKVFTNGKYSYDFTSPALSMRIKILAEGYIPASSDIFYNDQQNITLDFELQKGKGPAGIVTTEDGKAVKDAEICLPTGFTRIENGQIANKDYQ